MPRDKGVGVLGACQWPGREGRKRDGRTEGQRERKILSTGVDLPYSLTTSSDREGTGPEGVGRRARSLRRLCGKGNSPLDFRFPRLCPLIWFTRGREREEEPNAPNNERAKCKRETEAFSPGGAEDSEHQSRKSFVTKRGTETRSHRECHFWSETKS